MVILFVGNVGMTWLTSHKGKFFISYLHSLQTYGVVSLSLGDSRSYQVDSQYLPLI